MNKLSCFKCNDGQTPLYCLNCAGEILSSSSNRPTQQRLRVRRVVGWLLILTYVIRIIVMMEFALMLLAALITGQYGHAAWAMAVIIAVCPAWNEPANDEFRRTDPPLKA